MVEGNNNNDNNETNTDNDDPKNGSTKIIPPSDDNNSDSNYTMSSEIEQAPSDEQQQNNNNSNDRTTTLTALMDDDEEDDDDADVEVYDPEKHGKLNESTTGTTTTTTSTTTTTATITSSSKISTIPKVVQQEDDDDDDIASQAAAALAAVAAAATAKGQSPAQAAKDARDWAQNMLHEQYHATTISSSSTSTNVLASNASSSAASLSAANRGVPNMIVTKLSAVKTHLRQRALETGSTVSDKLGAGDNDGFLQHLLLLGYVITIDEEEEEEEQPTQQEESQNHESSSSSSEAAAEACGRLEKILKKIEAAYDSLQELLPDITHNNKNNNTQHSSDHPPPPEDYLSSIVPDLLPPCYTKNDVTLAFFRACMGHDSATAAATTASHEPTTSTSTLATSTLDSKEQASASSNNSMGGGSLESPALPSPPGSPKTPVKSTTATSSVFQMFKRHSTTPASPSSSVTKSGGGFSVFRKSNKAAAKKGGDDSQRSVTEPSSSEMLQQHHHSPGGISTTQYPGEYKVRIEREMLGLTVENVLERTVVRTVVPGGPAKKAGAKVGSLILRVNNVETKYLTHFETIDELRQSNRPLMLHLRQVPDEALRAAREEMGRLIKGSGFGTASARIISEDLTSSEGSSNAATSNTTSRPLIEADLRIEAYTNLIQRRFAIAGQVSGGGNPIMIPNPRNKKEEALNRIGEKLVWILTLFVVGLEREAAHLLKLVDATSSSTTTSKLPKNTSDSSLESGASGSSNTSSPDARKKAPLRSNSYHQHRSKDYMDAAKSIAKVLFDYTRKKLDPHAIAGANKNGPSASAPSLASQFPGGRIPPPPPPMPGRGGGPRLRHQPHQHVFVGTADTSVTHEKPLLQIGDVLQRTRTFLVETTSPPAALLRGELIAFLCDVLDIDTEMELSREEAVVQSSSSLSSPTSAGGINDLGSAGSLLKLIVLNCPIMRSPGCEESAQQLRDDPDLDEEVRRRFGGQVAHGGAGSKSSLSIDTIHRLHAGNRFLAVVHRLAASRSVSARITACSLGPVIWGHLDFPHQLQLRGVITRALHDVEVIVRKSTAAVLHEIAELVFDSRSVPWLVLMCERAMTDPEPQLRSAAMTLTWHLAEHLPNAFLGDASQGSRYLRRLPSREDPLFADVYLLQCKLLPVATRLSEDRSPSVRLAVAAQCDRLCDALGDHWSSVIIDVLLGLLSDTDERVRCEAVSCVPRLSEIVLLSSAPGETAVSEVSILEALLPAAIKLQKDGSVSVRVALAAAAGELLTLLVSMQQRVSEPGIVSSPSFGSTDQPLPSSPERRPESDAGRKYKMQVDDRLIPMVQSLLNDSDPEVTSAALRAVTNATRSSTQFSRNRHATASIDDDAASLSSYHSMASRSEKPVILPVLSEAQVLRLLPTLTELSDSKQWRVRQSAVEIVPALLGCTQKLETRTEISKLCVRLMGDQVDAVRKTAAECLCMGGTSLGSHGEDAAGEWITSIVIPTIRKCAIHSLSKQRLLSLKMIEVVLLNGVCPTKWYSTSGDELTDSPTRELITIALSLTTDRIANVRLNVGRILETILHVFDEKDVAFIKEVVLEQLSAEKDREGGGDPDVIFFANRCIKRASALLEERSSLGGQGSEEIQI